MNYKKSSSAGQVQVVIYSRPGCHLCEEVKQAIQAAECSDEYTLEEINIESDPELLRLYRYEIPVITIDGIEAFRHRLTPKEFRQRLESVRNNSQISRDLQNRAR